MNLLARKSLSVVTESAATLSVFQGILPWVVLTLSRMATSVWGLFCSLQKSGFNSRQCG